jgi:hypothetical protein
MADMIDKTLTPRDVKRQFTAAEAACMAEI